MKTTITRAELKQLLNNKNNIMVIDVRGKDEYMDDYKFKSGNLIKWV